MSTIEDFENAPVGATATGPSGRRAVKTFNEREPWRLESNGWSAYALSTENLVNRFFTLDPAPAPAPTTAREALDLAWNLAHPVKEGQMFPAGTELLQKNLDGTIRAAIMPEKKPATEIDENHTRTLGPFPDPEPDWMEAPAVLARHVKHAPDSRPSLWVNLGDRLWGHAETTKRATVWDLRDVTPLYPKEDR